MSGCLRVDGDTIRKSKNPPECPGVGALGTAENMDLSVAKPNHSPVSHGDVVRVGLRLQGGMVGAGSDTGKPDDDRNEGDRQANKGG